jgi:hypothetical protein
MNRRMDTLRDIAWFSAKAKQHAAAYENAVVRRDAAIAKAWEDDVPRKAIAEAAGLSEQRISQMAKVPRKAGRRRKQEEPTP